MSACDLAAFGLPGLERARSEPPETAEDRQAEARLACALLGATVAFVYAISATGVIGRLPGTGAVLLAIALAQAAWVAGWRRGGRGARRQALRFGAGLNALLVVLWAMSRTRGLPFGPAGAQPVGLIDSLCALDSCVLGALALSTLRPGLPVHGATHLAILLAVISLAALAGGHTHAAGGHSLAAGAARGEHLHFYCRLL